MSETNNMTPQDYAAFLESLKVNSEGQDEWRLIIPDKDIRQAGDQICHASKAGAGFRLEWIDIDPRYYGEVYGSWGTLDGQIVARRKSNAKPSDLVEQVKRAVRAGMDAEVKTNNAFLIGHPRIELISNNRDEFRRLSEAATEAKP